MYAAGRAGEAASFEAGDGLMASDLLKEIAKVLWK